MSLFIHNFIAYCRSVIYDLFLKKNKSKNYNLYYSKKYDNFILNKNYKTPSWLETLKVKNKIAYVTSMNSVYHYLYDRLGSSSIKLFDIEDNNFYENILRYDPDGILFAIEHTTNIKRNLYREKMHLIRQDGYNVWPNCNESFTYESKIRLYNFLKKNKISHPNTYIFYNKDEASRFVHKYNGPLILKTDLGAGSSGIHLLDNNLKKKKAIKLFFDSGLIRSNRQEKDWGYIILQEFIPEVLEYRIIKIGDYWFGHEKISDKNSIFKSGSGLNSWSIPEEDIFNFCLEISQKYEFNVAAFDIFKDNKGLLLVNEIQTWFGSYNPSQMYKDGVPGAFIHKNNEWKFIDGYYNINGSLNLRIKEFDNFLTATILS